MVKLNRVYGWEPEPYYNITEVMRKNQNNIHHLYGKMEMNLTYVGNMKIKNKK